MNGKLNLHKSSGCRVAKTLGIIAVLFVILALLVPMASANAIPVPRVESAQSAESASLTPYAWHTLYGSSESDAGYGIAADGNGNLYIVGISATTWNGPAGQTPLHDHSSGTNNDIVVTKLNNRGEYLWHTFYGSPTAELPMHSQFDIAVDSNANVYVVASSDATWNGPTGQAPRHGYSGQKDCVALKLDGNGAYQWHTFYGSGTDDYCYGIATDGTGNIYITGQSDATWNGPTGQLPLHAHSFGWGTYDIVTLRLDSSGAYQWHTFYGAAPYELHGDVGVGIALDGNGNVYVTGYSDNTWNGPTGQGPLHAHSSPNAEYDLFVLKLNGSGGYLWHTFYGSAFASAARAGDRGYNVVVVGDDVYVSGMCNATWNGPTGQSPLHPHSSDQTYYDLFALKLNSSGTYQWHTFYGSTGVDVSFNASAVDSRGNVYVAAYSNANWQGDGGTSPIYGYTGGYDMVALKLNSSGTYQWHTFLGSSSDDTAYGITVDGNGNVYASGGANATWNGPSGQPPLHDHSSGTNADIAVVKLIDRYLLYLPLILR